jgi:hypothetical protein
MASKPATAAGYPPEMAVAARQMCLYIATILGDLLDDIVVVGGLVPYLIIDQIRCPRRPPLRRRPQNWYPAPTPGWKARNPP